MMFNLVLPLLFLSLYSTLTFAEEEENAAAAAVVGEMHLPPNCNYSEPNYWAHKLHCRNKLPDFTSTNHTFLATITELTIDRCPSAVITRETFTHFRNLDSLEIDCDEVIFEEGALDFLTKLNNIKIQKNVAAFPRHLFCHLKRLSTVTLSNNAIDSDDAFGFGHCSNDTSGQSLYKQRGIQIFDAANNRITSITKDGFLRNLPALNLLVLENNSIATIEKEALVGVPALERLYLAGNLINELPADTFDSANNLYYLNLSDNRLTQLPTFSSLEKLKILDLSNNRIEEINAAFQNLTVHYVHLNGNRLRTIDSDTIDGLKFAWELHFHNNSIETISVDIFEYCVRLSILDLSHNRLKEFPTCRVQHHVHDLRMDYNEIAEFNASDSNFKDGIHRLSLAHNKLTSIGPQAFAEFHKLNELDLSNNNIESLDNSAFDGLSELRRLNLSWNKISFQNNALVFYGKPYEMPLFTGLKNLYNLDLSNNEISELFYSQFPAEMTWLALDGNQIHTLHPETFKGLNDLREINLRNNSLFTLPMLDLPSPYTTIMPEGNPWLCDCEIGWLNNWKTGMSSVFDPQSMTCDVFFDREAGDKESSAFIQKLNRNFICATFENKVCHSRVFAYKCLSWNCQQRQLCPDNCVCYHNYNWRIVKLVCSNSSTMVQIPKKIPSATDVAVFYNVSITSIAEDTFHDYTNVKHLAIRNTRLSYIHENAFKSMTIVETIDLNHNELTALDHLMFKGLSNLKHIDLSFNKLTSINSNVFDSIKFLPSIAIGGNPWSCNCTFLEPFNNFLISHARSIVNATEMYCKHDPLSDDIIPFTHVKCN